MKKSDVKKDPLQNHHFKVPRAPQRGKGSAKASKRMLLGVQGRVKTEPFFDLGPAWVPTWLPGYPQTSKIMKICTILGQKLTFLAKKRRPFRLVF